MPVAVGRILTVTVEVDVEGVHALVPEPGEAAHVVTAEVEGFLEPPEHAAFLAVPVRVIRVIDIGTVVGKEVIAHPANPLRIGLPSFGEGDMSCFQDLGILEIIPITDLNHTLGS